MTETKKAVVEKPPEKTPIKEIVLTGTGTRHWDCRFTGNINRRDLQIVLRKIQNEFNAMVRRRSAKRMMEQLKKNQDGDLNKEKTNA